MMNNSTCIEMNPLPADVFDFKHDEFYNFVDYQCGPVQSKILKFQLISDADTFLECTDPTEILKYNSTKLNDLKAESCLMTDEHSFVIFPGIIASFRSLKKRLMKKIDENIKEIKRNKASLNVSTSTLSTAPVSTQPKTVDELRNHLTKSINQWLDKYRNDLNLKADCLLSESIDYTIEFKNNLIGQQSVVITCACGSKASLCRHSNDGFYKLSNFYRHLERGSCSTMKKKVNDQTNQSGDCDESNANSQSSESSIDLSTSTDLNSKKTRHHKRPVSLNHDNRDRLNKRKRI